MKSDKPEILVASTNPGKMKELIELLGELASPIPWKSLADFRDLPEVVEDGSTFARNAQKKALGYAKATGMLTIADDSGLCIDALGGQPGVQSARFANEVSKDTDRKAVDRSNYEKVLHLMQGVPAPQRTARFICHLCLASPKEVLIQAEGIVEGTITETPRGEGGFGYDPIFLIPELNRTAAELTPDEKNQISHRARAIQKFKPMLLNYLNLPAA